MNNYDADYKALVDKVIKLGYRGPSRAGPTISLPGQHLTINLNEGFPILTSRKIFYHGVFGELAAFIRGAETLDVFEAYGCNYWKENAANWAPNQGLPQDEWRVGKIYGSMWRDFHGVDQLSQVIESIKKDPYGRRHILATWDPSELNDMCLPPCHLLCQFYVRNGKLFTHVYMRSLDLMLGLPSDVVLYALLTHLVAKDCGLIPWELSYSFGDCHIYACHLDQWVVQREQKTYPLPRLDLHTNAPLYIFDPMYARVICYRHSDPVKYAFCA